MVAVTADKVVTVLQADVDQYIAGINAAQGNFAQKLALMQAEAQQMGSVMDIAGRNSAKAFQAVNQNAPKAATAVKGINTQLAYLPAQLNDIAVQLAGGTSPLLIMVQQGTQITQAFGGLGARGAVSALGAAFGSMVNPVNLAVFALIAATGYAAQYFSTLVEGGEKSEAQLKKEAELIANVAAKWGDVLPALKAYNDERQKLADEKDIHGAIAAAVAGEYEPLKKTIRDINVDMADLLSQLQATGQSDAGIQKLQEAFGGLLKDIENNDASVDKLKGVQAALSDVYLQTHIPAANAMAIAIGGIADELERTIAAGQKLKADDALRDFYKSSPLGTIPPVTSGGGKILDPQQLQDFTANEANLKDAGESAAASMLKGFEGFIAHAKYDVNAYRVGYGSDTKTNADGSIEKVTKDTVVTLDDAQRDLSRRILEFQSGIQDAIGSDTWRSLSEAQQAALTSIAYNYGKLPKSIVAAIQSGGGPAIVADAISKLSANPKRRMQEAEAYGGNQFSTAAPKKSPDEIFQGSLDEVQAKIATIKAETEATAGLTRGTNEYQFALDKARIKQDLLNKAKQIDGLEITPELIAQIDAHAESLAKLQVQQDMVKESSKEMAEAQKQFNELGREVLGGIIDDLRAGKDAGEIFANVLDKLADKFEQMALDAIFPTGGTSTGGGLLGGLGSLLGGLFKASGGPVRKGQPYVVGEKRAELFIPDQNGTIMPSVPNITTPSRAGNSGGGAIQVQSTVGVVNGELVPLMTRVSGIVAGQQVKSASKSSPSRLTSYQSRGT